MTATVLEETVSILDKIQQYNELTSDFQETVESRESFRSFLTLEEEIRTEFRKIQHLLDVDPIKDSIGLEFYELITRLHDVKDMINDFDPNNIQAGKQLLDSTAKTLQGTLSRLWAYAKGKSYTQTTDQELEQRLDRLKPNIIYQTKTDPCFAAIDSDDFEFIDVKHITNARVRPYTTKKLAKRKHASRKKRKKLGYKETEETRLVRLWPAEKMYLALQKHQQDYTDQTSEESLSFLVGDQKTRYEATEMMKYHSQLLELWAQTTKAIIGTFGKQLKNNTKIITGCYQPILEDKPANLYSLDFEYINNNLEDIDTQFTAAIARACIDQQHPLLGTAYKAFSIRLQSFFNSNRDKSGSFITQYTTEIVNDEEGEYETSSFREHFAEVFSEILFSPEVNPTSFYHLFPQARLFFNEDLTGLNEKLAFAAEMYNQCSETTPYSFIEKHNPSLAEKLGSPEDENFAEKLFQELPYTRLFFDDELKPRSYVSIGVPELFGLEESDLRPETYNPGTGLEDITETATGILAGLGNALIKEPVIGLYQGLNYLYDASLKTSRRSVIAGTAVGAIILLAKGCGN